MDHFPRLEVKVTADLSDEDAGYWGHLLSL